MAQTTEGRRLVAELTVNRPLGVYVSGKPGTGKSTLLLHMILDDIRASRACCVLDPHGDLVAAVLRRLPEDGDTLRRVVLFDPSDTDWPIGISLLDASTERTRDLAVQFMLDLYDELYLRGEQGPMLHQSLRNGMRLLMEVRGSLAELPLLFSDPEFAKKRLAESKDPWVDQYFEKIWLPWRGDSRGEHLSYFTSKLSCFFDDHILRNILGQRQGLDLNSVLTDGGVLLANLARGAIGELDSRILGMILLHKLERLAVERSARGSGLRPRLHVYVDEFQEFATPSLLRFLPAARKFNVGITLAHQRLETLDPRSRETILGATGHVVLFRQGANDGWGAVRPLVWPRYGERELLSVPNFEAVARVTSADGAAHVGRIAVPKPTALADDTLPHVVSELTHARVARRRAEVEAEILERLGWQERSNA